MHSLQRCLTYRLGNRLPLKGPGYILKLPFIDHISIIDLYEDRFNIIESEEEVLTSTFHPFSFFSIRITQICFRQAMDRSLQRDLARPL